MTVSNVELVRCLTAFVESVAEQTGDYTMGAQQQLLLLSLYEHGTLNQQDLPKFTGVEKSANARNIARLGSGQFVVPAGSEQKVHKPGLGLVEADQDPMDRRVNLVRLTAKGKSVVERAARKASARLL